MTNVKTIERAAIAPYVFEAGKFHGGLDGCDLARMRSGRNFRDVPAPVTGETFLMPGRYLYAGPLWNHFGHILVDSPHRLWAFKDHDAIVFNGVIGLRGVHSTHDLALWNYPPLIDKILSILGIDAPVFIVRRPTTFQTLDVPEAGAEWKMNVKQFYRPHLRRYQEAIEKAVEGIEPIGKRLYYPRTHLLTDGGIIGSSYFEEALAANGFAICRPEKLSLDQQFANLLKADQIVFDEGSSIHLSELFDYLPAKAYMLPRRAGDDVFCRALTPRGGMVTLADADNVEMLPDRNGNMSPASLSFYRDPQSVIKRMMDYGLITEPFDARRYHDAEMHDLLSAKAADKAARQQRIDRLAEFRKIAA